MCHNRKGRPVVDYILTAHRNVNKCIKRKVYNINRILNKHVEILNTISSSYKAPDHSIVKAELAF